MLQEQNVTKKLNLPLERELNGMQQRPSTGSRARELSSRNEKYINDTCGTLMHNSKVSFHTGLKPEKMYKIYYNNLFLYNRIVYSMHLSSLQILNATIMVGPQSTTPPYKN